MRAIEIPSNVKTMLEQRPGEVYVEANAIYALNGRGNLLVLIPDPGQSLADVSEDEINSMIVNALS